MGFRIVGRSAKARDQVQPTASSGQRSPEATVDEWGSRLRGAIGKLDTGVQEYNRVYHSRKSLLRRISELSIRSERMGLKGIVRELENILEDEGVVRFDPEVGESLPRDRCASTPVPTSQFPPGLIVYVESPGYVTADGEVILKARVGESTKKVDPASTEVILSSEAAKDNVGLLLVLSAAASASQRETYTQSAGR